MVQFGKHLAESRREVWADEYLKYKVLKKLVKRMGDLSESTTLDKYRQLDELQQKFFGILDDELARINLFYLAQEEVFAQRIKNVNTLRESLADGAEGGDANLARRVLIQKQNDADQFYHHIRSYVELNYVG